MKIAVIGAGVCGLTSAVKLAEYYYDNPNIQLVLISDEVTPNTTGDGSAGLWGPYLCGDTPVQNILKWSKETHDFFYDLWRNGMADEVGICLQPIIRLTVDEGGYPDPEWKNIVFGCTKLRDDEVKRLSEEHGRNYTGGYHHVSFSCEPTRFLPYLFKRFKQAGGKFINQKIRNFDELESFDMIINCTGMGARQLAHDEKVRPIRGQVARAVAPWMYHSILDDSDDGNYIIPNMETVILGGTHQLDDYNRTVTKKDSEFILDGCQNMIPSLKNAKIKREWVGLRPGRASVRLEKEIYRNKTGGNTIVIHNYGHGGCGVTMSWGCATDVLDLVKNNLHVPSKL